MKATQDLSQTGTMFRAMIVAMAILVAVGSSRETHAQNVEAKLSSREAWKGQPIFLMVTVSNASRYDSPQIPDVSGLDIRLAQTPTRSSRTTMINGRVTRKTSINYLYQVTADEKGSHTIPPIKVMVDGKTQTTPEFTFTVGVSETGDLMFAEVEGQQEKAYVGQQINLKLKIWIRPYRDDKLRLTLSEGNMWQLILENTSWGVFQDRIDELNAARQRLRGTQVWRTDDEGISRVYYLFELEAEIYPQRPGAVDIGDVQITAEYPSELRPARRRMLGDDDLFGGVFEDFFRDSPFNRDTLQITASRPISVDVELPSIEIVDVPTLGRPADYRGAVGKYAIGVQATSTSVKAGDPITLQIVLQGDGPMELVQAPPISSLAELARDFKVSDEALAGFVKDDAKLFTTSIRPLREDATEIPPIPFTFFDPETETFETVRSRPIAISVAPAETLSLDSIAAPSRRKAKPPASKMWKTAEVEDDRLAAVSVEAMLTDAPAVRSGSWWPFLLAPLGFLGCWLGKNWNSVEARLRAFFGISHGPIASAIQRVRLAETASELSEILGTAFGGQVPADVAELMRRCNQSAYSPLQSESFESLQEAVLVELNSYRSDSTKPPAVSAARGVAVTLLIAIPLVPLDHVHASEASSLKLSETQVRTILAEANELHTRALAQSAAPEDVKVWLEDAIERYELVANDGLRSANLFASLGDARLQAGDLARAVASYEQARRYAPTNRALLERLRVAREVLQDPKLASQLAESLGKGKLPSPEEISSGEVGLQEVSQRLSQELGLWNPMFRTLAILGWFAFWIGACVRLFNERLPVAKPFVAPLIWGSLTIFLLSISATMMARSELTHNAVTIAESTELRAADGTSFPVTANLVPGRRIELIEQRGDWVRVRANDESGWTQQDAVIRIRS